MATRSLTYSSGSTLKTVLRDFSTGSERVWNTDAEAFEAYDAGNIVDYGLAVTEGSPGSYSWTVPVGLPASASGYAYEATTYKIAAADLALADLANGVWLSVFAWNGSEEVETTDPGESGTYWTWEGIKNLLGEDNAAVVSNMDNDDAEPDLTRVAADGTIADAYVNWWAAESGYTTPVADTTRDFGRIRLAANYKTSGLLYGHREWWEIPNEQLDQYVNVMEAKADAILAELFGPKPTGTDAEALPDGDTTPPAGTFQFVPITRGTRACGDEYSTCN